MGKIDTSGWKEYRMSDLGFTVCHGSRITKAERVEGDTVFLTAGFENCGVVGTIGNENIDIWEKPITVDMFGNVFYHDETCAGDDNIYAFLNSKLSRTAKLFVASSIVSVTQSKYSYQQQFRQGDANKLSVYLPCTPNGDPDWAYMESYMANLETKVAESLTLLQAAKDAEKKKVDTREWGEFRVGELFEVKISKSVDKGGLEFAEDGEYDFIGRTPLNNGIQGKLNKLKFEANQEGTYSIAQIGMHVCQYRERKWYASQNIFVLTPFAEKSHKANKFIATVITRYLDCAYGEDTYATYPTAKTLPHLKIKLPVDKTGQPDWAYMEEYMRKVERKTEGMLNQFMSV
jgi:hypothetical protein